MYNQERFLAEKFFRLIRSYGYCYYIYSPSEISEQCMTNAIQILNQITVNQLDFQTFDEEDGSKIFYARVKIG